MTTTVQHPWQFLKALVKDQIISAEDARHVILAQAADRQRHPWEIAADLVDRDILTKEQALGVILAHESVHRRILHEIHEMLPELCLRDELTEEGAQRIRRVVQRAAREGQPDL